MVDLLDHSSTVVNAFSTTNTGIPFRTSLIVFRHASRDRLWSQLPEIHFVSRVLISLFTDSRLGVHSSFRSSSNPNPSPLLFHYTLNHSSPPQQTVLPSTSSADYADPRSIHGHFEARRLLSSVVPLCNNVGLYCSVRAADKAGLSCSFF